MELNPGRQLHNPVHDDTSWWCPDCGDRDEGYADCDESAQAADDHVITAWEVERGLADLRPWDGAPPMGVPYPGEVPL